MLLLIKTKHGICIEPKKEDDIKSTAPGGSAGIPANSTASLSPKIEHKKESIPPVASVASDPIPPLSTNPATLTSGAGLVTAAPPSQTVEPINAQSNAPSVPATPGRGRPRIHPIGSVTPGSTPASVTANAAISSTTTAATATAATPSSSSSDPSKTKSSSSTHSSKPPKESKSNKTNLTSMKVSSNPHFVACSLIIIAPTCI